MRRIIVLLLVIATIFCLSLPSFSSIQPPLIDEAKVADEGISLSLPGRLRSLWQRRRRLMADRNLPQVEELDSEILRLAKEGGIKALPELAGAYFTEARTFFNKGIYKEARSDLKKAISLDPYLSPSYYLLGRISLKNSDIIPAAKWYLKGIRASTRSLLGRYLILMNILYLLLLSSVAGILTFLILKLIKYHKQIRHDFEEFWGERLPPLLVSGLAIFYLFAPLLLFLGAGIFILYLMIISWRYYKGAEKFFAWVSLIMMTFLFPITNLSLGLLDFSRSPKLEVAANFIEERLDAITEHHLTKMVKTESNDLTAHILLALEYQREEKFDLAFAEYGKLLQKHPELSLAYNNRGNILFLSGHPELAIEHYKRAVELDPVNPIPYYNLSLAYSELLDFDQANKMMNEARRLEPSLSPPPSESQARTIDMKPTKEELLSWAFKDLSHFLRRRVRSNPGTIWGSILLNPLTISGFVALLLVLIISIAFRDLPTARVCEMCGKPFCYRCRVGIPENSYCSQCYHLFIKRDGVSPQAKELKLSQIGRYQFKKKFLRYLITLILPGGGHQLGGQAGWGGVLTFSWLILFLSFLLYPFLLTTSPLFSGGWSPVRILLGIGGVIVYLLSILSLKGGDQWH